MVRSPYHRVSGFTLTEMAIVLAVVGILVAGLYNILSGANTQVRDEGAASQQQQLISAVSAFLSTQPGSAFMANNEGCGLTVGCGPVASGQVQAFQLPLPSACSSTGIGTFPTTPFDYNTDNNLTGTAAALGFCSFLPPGFTSSTTNSYGQSYRIQIQRDNTLNSGVTIPPFSTAPNTYSFMILASGGDTISDTSGARISSLIGGDGGFVYSNNVCDFGGSTTNATACGAYGGWSSTTGAFGFPAPTAPAYSGSIASRTYTSPQQILNTPWLARVFIPPGPAISYNTMTVPEYLGGSNPTYANELDMGAYNPPSSGGMTQTGGSTINLQSGVLNFGYQAPLGAAGVSGTMNMQGGTINFNYASAPVVGIGTMNAQGGTINMNTSGATGGGGTINLQGGEITSIDTTIPAPNGLGNEALVLNGTTNAGSQFYINSVITANEGCTIKQYIAATGTWADQNGNPCGFAITTNSLTSGGLIEANGFYAGTFVYNTSGGSSDIRLKKNIQPVTNSLDDLMKLKPVSYTFKENGKEGMGVIAQDLEKVYPKLVFTGFDGMKAVNYDGLIAPLIDAVQELKKENDDLRQELKADEARQQKLEQELSKKSAN